MPYEDKMNAAQLPHNLILEAREHLSVSGVLDVESFDEESVVLHTTLGMLVLRGSGLHIEKLSLDEGELTLEGHVDSLHYEETQRSGGGFWSRLFK